MRRLLLPVVLTLALAACGDRLPAEANGPEIYASVCARCHGPNLGGGVGPALDAGSAASEQPIEFYLQTIERGLGRMPSYGGTLTSEQIERVAAYIFEQQGR